MRNFGWCIWLIPEKESLWHTYTDGFSPHITIKSCLEQKEALKLFNSIQKSLEAFSLTVCLQGYCQQTYSKKFAALYYDVNPVPSTTYPSWWPENAHMSFRYQYSKLFDSSDLSKLDSTINQKTASVTSIALVHCNGHYSTWKTEQEYCA